MNNFIDKMERKFGRFAIANLTKYIIGLYIIGYVLDFAPKSVNFMYLFSLDPELVLQGQIWRLFTWLLIPPAQFSILLIITLLFYYYVGTSLERTIGTFRYNLFIFSGMLLMIASSFVAYFLFKDVTIFSVNMRLFSYSISTYYIQMTVLFAFAICYPDTTVLFMMFIPLKVKWLAYFYAALVLYDCYSALRISNYFMIAAVISQAINLLLFYLSLGKLNHLRPKEVKRRNEFKKNVQIRPKGITRHKCAVCGRTEEDDPNLEFRFCSKCNGNYEYCQDHLFTHEHVK
ncbi:hypothetical protein D6853_04070 [Butyrivibrio sp. X503]|uniref:hypothetical protein n=1 Tax=Butyrivibrio sp. X503 TaxID=2364878 RepID=UPI000EA83B59|nr:hypothetical protein [Butyrivibrio sp. X503]RKM57201.1 hypothetical protein D6853_04070 [Butyrivibrio sp. X503]